MNNEWLLVFETEQAKRNTKHSSERTVITHKPVSALLEGLLLCANDLSCLWPRRSVAQSFRPRLSPYSRGAKRQVFCFQGFFFFVVVFFFSLFGNRKRVAPLCYWSGLLCLNSPRAILRTTRRKMDCRRTPFSTNQHPPPHHP